MCICGKQTTTTNDDEHNNNINAFLQLHSSAGHPLIRVMTRITPRQRCLAELQEDICWFKEEQEFKLLCDDDPFDDLDLLLEADLKDRYNHLCSQGFIAHKGTYCCGNSWQIFKEDLLESSNRWCWLNDFEFKLKYGMLRVSFWKLHDLIKGHKVFRVKGTKQQQMPPEFQLMVLLAFLWTKGDGMSDKKARSLFRLSTGEPRTLKIVLQRPW
jgi:hypothetical protein